MGVFMRIDWNNKYNTIAIYSIIVIFSGIFLFLGISNFNLFGEFVNELFAIGQPFIIGGVIAYLINYILNFYEYKLLKTKYFPKLSKKGKRGIAITLAYITAGIILFIFIKIIFPQLIDSVVGLANNIPQYVTDTTNKLNEIFKSIDIPESYGNIALEKWNELVSYIINIVTNTVPTIANGVFSIMSSILNIIIGIIISVYILIDKDKFMAQGKKLCYATFNEKFVDRLLVIFRRSNNIFGNFIGGKIVDSVIIGIITFMIMFALRMPYAVLVSVMVGITNIIPVFGPFIGAIPGFIIILFVSPIQALWFLVVIVIIQQLDGNIIGPYILGDSVGLSAFWILFSVLVFSKLFGVVGMIIGVPIFAVIYSIIKENVEWKLEKKGLPIETLNYLNNITNVHNEEKEEAK